MRLIEKCLLVTVATVAMASLGVKVYADTAGDIEQDYGTGNTNPDTMVLWDDASGGYPIVNAIGSQPGVYGGHTFTYWAVLAQDSTGSMDEDVSTSQLNTLSRNNGNTYGTPLTSFSVGTAFSSYEAWVPFHQIPEVTPYPSDTNIAGANPPNPYITLQGTGSTAPATVTTISTVLGLGNGVTNNLTLAGTYVEIKNVTISGSTGSYSSTFPAYLSNIAAETYTISDGSTNMAFFDWTTSYSVDAAMGGSAVPTGPVNVYGFLSVNPGAPNAEFVPLAIVPEPSAFVLAGMGLLGLLAIRRSRRS